MWLAQARHDHHVLDERYALPRVLYLHQAIPGPHPAPLYLRKRGSMSKLYHVTLSHPDGTGRIQKDIIASRIDVAVKRAIDSAFITAKSIRIEANLSNHGEYDKLRWEAFKATGETVYSYHLKRRDGTYVRLPAVVQRSEAAERAGIMAEQVLGMSDEADILVGVSRGRVLCEVKRAGVEINEDVRDAIAKRLRYAKLL